jgi:Tfp pilus assembly major pilin PilA
MQIHIHREGQNFGPYSLEEVNAYLQSGNLGAGDLAWYEGAADWMPLEAVPGVVGARAVAAATMVRQRPAAVAKAKPQAKPKPQSRPKMKPKPAPRPAGAPRSGIPTWAIVTIVLGGAFLVLLLFGAAIAIPAYADYKSRAQVSEALLRAQPAKMQITEIALETRELPDQVEDLAAQLGGPLKRIEWRDGLLMLELADVTDDAQQAAILALEPYYDSNNELLNWRCAEAPAPSGLQELTDADSATATTVPRRLLPASCR